MRWTKQDEEHLIAHLNGDEPLPHKRPRWWKVLLLCTVAVLLWDLIVVIKL